MVKWLRHRPFTAVTRVQIPSGSPTDMLTEYSGENPPGLDNFQCRQGSKSRLPAYLFYMALSSNGLGRGTLNTEMFGSNPASVTNMGG